MLVPLLGGHGQPAGVGRPAPLKGLVRSCLAAATKQHRRSRLLGKEEGGEGLGVPEAGSSSSSSRVMGAVAAEGGEGLGVPEAAAAAARVARDKHLGCAGIRAGSGLSGIRAGSGLSGIGVGSGLSGIRAGSACQGEEQVVACQG